MARGFVYLYLNLMGLSLLLSVASAQVVPLGLGLEQDTQVVVFVEDNCPACEALISRLWGLNARYVGSEPELPYPDYRQDEYGFAARTLRIETYPTVLVLQDGHEVQRQEADTIDPEVMQAAVAALREGLMIPQWLIGIEVGQQVEGYFEDYTGLLVFWQEDCEPCRQEAEQLEGIVVEGLVEVRIVAPEENVPDTLTEADAPGIREAWGIQGHVRVYLEDGVPVWIDLGYREDVREMVETVVRVREGVRPSAF